MGTEIIGVSFDTPDASRAFADKQRFPFPLIPDTDRNLGLAYGAARSLADEYAQRIAYLIDAEGRIEQVHPNVNPRAYPAEQLSYLTAMG